ncbi:MAG: M12 family metallo-peptidase, partial [Saprospiraceae bacterium]
MNKILILLGLMLIFQSTTQSQVTGFCGSTALDNLSIKNRMVKNREDASLLNIRTGAIKYVPVTYFLVAKSDGTGRAKYINILLNLCAINEIYKDQDISFYLKGGGTGMIDVNNTLIYDDPSSTFGNAAITQLQNKNKNAINIFVASKANGTNLGVLAFYNPTNDNLVSDLKYVTGTSPTTLAHEIGHYFSLAHTFFGWENDTYDCSIPTPTEHFLNGRKVLVEYVDRLKPLNNNLHCNEAADGFCDTQADYNFGFGWSGGCTWKSDCAKDPDENKPMDPDELNIMSYFLNCLKTFSLEQKAAIARDYASSARNYLKSPAHIPLPAVTEAPKNPRIESDGFNSVTFKWDAPANATHYILEFATVTLSNSMTYKNFILTRTDTTFTNLAKGIKYAWKVTAFNVTNPCPMSTGNLSFFSSSFGVATQDVNNLLANVQVYDNHSNQYRIEIEANEKDNVKFELFSIDGKLIHSEQLNLTTGKNQFTRNLIQSGVYSFRIHNNKT